MVNLNSDGYKRERKDTDVLKEHGRLSQHTLCFFQLSLLLDQSLPRTVHLSQPTFVFLQLLVKLIDRLGTPGSDSDKGRDGGQGGNVDRGLGDRGDLGAEEPKPSIHLVQSADVTDKGSLESVDFGVEL